MSLAMQISEDDRCRFQGLEDQVVTAVDDNTILSPLNLHWNNLCHTVEECAAAGPEIRSKMTRFAMVIYPVGSYVFLLIVRCFTTCATFIH